MSEELKPCPCGGLPVEGSRNDPFRRGGMRTNGPEWRTIGCPKCLILFCEVDSPDRHPQRRREWLRQQWDAFASDNQTVSGEEGE